jgi:hypothetical protein
VSHYERPEPSQTPSSVTSSTLARRVFSDGGRFFLRAGVLWPGFCSLRLCGTGRSAGVEALRSTLV